MPGPGPAPPTVYGPIYTTSPQVNVGNVLPASTVNVYASGISAPIGTAKTTTESGSIWVPVTTKLLVALQQITATQTYTGTDTHILQALGGTTESQPSTTPMPVLKTPDPLPAPVFDSGLCTCMDWVLIGRLTPGATLTITLANPSAKPPFPTVVNETVGQSVQWFQLASGPPIPVIERNAILEARQSGLMSVASPTVKSKPIQVAPPLLAPVISPQPLACETSLSFSNMQPGADLNIVNGPAPSNEYLDETSPGPSYTLALSPPLKAGGPSQSYAQQYFTKCGTQEGPVFGPKTHFAVIAGPPPKPDVTYPPCQNVTYLMVSDVVAGEILTLTYSYTSKTTGKELSDQPLTAGAVSGQGSTPSPFPLPSNWYPTDATPGTVTVQIVGLLCAAKSIPFSIPVVQPPRASGPPTLQPPLNACATSVFVLGAQPGSWVQVLSGSAPPVGTPISYPALATTPNFPISLFPWSPLVKGEPVFVTQQGCNAFPNSPVVTVGPAPPLEVPTVVGGNLLGATSVLVSNVVPGAQVTLFVNGEARGPSVDSIQAEIGPPLPPPAPQVIDVSLPVGSPPLTENDVLSAGQSLCGVNKLPPVGGGGVMVQQAAPAPPAAAIGDPGGLFGNSNYILYTPNGSGGCENLLDVSVTIQVTEDIVFNEVTSGSCTEGIIKGFGFQLNCYSPTGPVVWQQFGIALLGTELNGFINTWASASDSLIAQPFPLLALPSIQLTAPFEMQITLSYDTSGSGNVIGVEWAVNGMKFPADILTLLSASHLPKTDVAPIVALMLTLVGPICGEGVVLSSGAGIFTYSAKSPLTVFTSTSPADDFPSCVAFADTTGETATSAYGPLPPNPPSPSFTQTFTASATTPMIRRKLAGPARR